MKTTRSRRPDPKVKFEPYGTNEPSKILKQVQHDAKEGEDQQVQHDTKEGEDQQAGRFKWLKR